MNDHFYFGKFSNDFFAIESLAYDTRALKNEEILLVFDKIWKAKTNLVILSRGWMSYYQIFAATIEAQSDSVYLHNKCELDSGVQVSYHANEDNTGVGIIVEPTMEESSEEIIVNTRTQRN